MEHIELTAEQTAVLDKLSELHTKVEELDDEFEKELIALEMKYHKLREPIFQDRRQILVAGEGATEGTPALPLFWLRALKSHPVLHFEKADEEILAFLQDIEVIQPEDNTQSFELVFHFAENPHFTNKTLSKKYDLLSADGDEVLNGITSTTIEWKEGKDITREVKNQVQKNKRTNMTRTVQVVTKTRSFFNFFNSLKLPSHEEMMKMGEEKAEELGEQIEEDYQVARIIRDKIVRDAVAWYKGEGVDSDLESAMDDDCGDSDFDGDDSELEGLKESLEKKGKKPECDQQ